MPRIGSEIGGLSPRPALGAWLPRVPGATLAWVTVYLTILLAWIAVWAMDGTTRVEDGVSVFGFDYLKALCIAAVNDTSLPALWAMWAIMGIAMMLPSAVPALRDYAQLAETAAARDAEVWPAMSALALVLGYLAVWFVFAICAALAQQTFARQGLLGPDGASVSIWLSAALIAIAGGWQFSPLKDACLRACQSPLLRFIAAWRPGPGPAFGMGLKLGAHCLGCCWALMALAFAGGTMNLAFMGLATLLMTAEKLPALGDWITRPLGMLLLVGSAALAGAGLAGARVTGTTLGF